MKEYDEKEPSSYIMYLDANNLYGWAMSQYLPTGGFKWLSEKQIEELDIWDYKEESKKGIKLEVIWNIQQNYTIYIMIFH